MVAASYEADTKTDAGYLVGPAQSRGSGCQRLYIPLYILTSSWQGKHVVNVEDKTELSHLFSMIFTERERYNLISPR